MEKLDKVLLSALKSNHTSNPYNLKRVIRRTKYSGHQFLVSTLKCFFLT